MISIVKLCGILCVRRNLMSGPRFRVRNSDKMIRTIMPRSVMTNFSRLQVSSLLRAMKNLTRNGEWPSRSALLDEVSSVSLVWLGLGGAHRLSWCSSCYYGCGLRLVEGVDVGSRGRFALVGVFGMFVPLGLMAMFGVVVDLFLG